MSKYEPLARRFETLEAAQWRPTFHELERLLGFDLPAAARKRSAWWDNAAAGANGHARAWLDAGWTADKVDLTNQTVSFVRAPAEFAPHQPGDETPAAAAKRLAKTARARVRAAGTGARDWAEEGVDRSAAFVRARPGLSIGVGAGLAFAGGVVLGMLLLPRSRSLRRRAGELAHHRADDAMHALKAALGRLQRDTAPAPAVVHSRAEALLDAVKEAIARLPLPDRAAHAARGRAEDALHAVRDGVRDLRAATKDRFGR